MADINRDISIEQIDYNIDINNINFTIDIQPRSNYTIELNAQGAQGRQGEKGDTGNGILSISKIKTEGNIDTYRITYTDGGYYDYTVTNASLNVEWGEILGSIENQLDLQEEFDTKQDKLIAGANITIEDNVISSSGGAERYGIKGDYFSRYGIEYCQHGLIEHEVNTNNITIKGGMVLVMPNEDTKVTIGSDIDYTVTSTTDFTLFYVNGGNIIEALDVVYSVEEPDNGTEGYIAWFNPEVNTWQFKSNDTGNVWRSANATPLADIKFLNGNIVRIDYIGYRIINDDIFALKSDIENLSTYTPSLLSFQWTDHILNDIRWLRADAFSWQDGTVYSGAYDTLEAEYNNENSVVESNYISSNVNIVGSLTDNQGVLSGFSTSNYAQIGTFSPSSQPYEIVIKFKTSSVSTDCDIIGSSVASSSGAYLVPQLRISSSKLVYLGASSNTITGTTTLQDNIWYWVKFTYNGSQRELLLSTDGKTYNSEGTIQGSATIQGGTLLLGNGAGEYQFVPFVNGLIDLNKSYININGSRWWSGVNGITYKRTPSKYKIADVSQEEAILNKYNTDGIAWYYIIDTVNKRFKLPRTKYGFTGVRDGVGNDVEAGLPNILGEINCTNTSSDAQFLSDENGNVSSKGALYITSTRSAKTIGQTANSATAPKGIGLDASRSSSIYKNNSNTVQPPATQMYLYFYVGSYTTDAIENTAGLNTELFNSKLDIDCNNTSATGKDFMSSMGMPSSRYIELTLGAAGSTYTAPANGWYVLFKTPTASNQYVSLDNLTSNLISEIRAGGSGSIGTYIPCKKDDIVRVGYSASGTTNRFVFIYAEGAE